MKRSAGVAEAEAALATVLAGATDEEVAIAEAGVSEAEAGLTSAQAGLAIAQAALADYELRAPFAGDVARVSVEEGESVSPGISVVSLSDSSPWYVETDDGVVTNIAPRSEIKRGDVTYTVTIKLTDADDAALLWGLTVFVDINVE
jgi:multidrug efflux pump subunit AcrA (membrane-fusion protein)